MLKNKIMKYFNLIIIMIIASMISGCGYYKMQENIHRQQYFQNASMQHYRFQQIAATKMHPTEFIVCGAKQYPCFASTALHPQHKYHRSIGGEKHHVK